MDRSPSPDEAVAIAAAVERFVAETAPPVEDGRRQAVSPWQQAALIEGVGKRATVEDLEGEGGASGASGNVRRVDDGA